MRKRRNAGSSITEARIIEAAIQLFSRWGFNGVGTREIARLADVNEATLFRLFARKKDLFWAAVEARLSRLKMSRELQSALSGDEDPSRVLPQICDFMVDMVVQQPDVMRLLYFAALEMPGSEHVYREHLGPVFDAISGYLARCNGRGTLQNMDPSITTFGLLGTVVAYTALYRLFTGQELPFANVQDASSAYSQFWGKALLKPIVQSCLAPMETQAICSPQLS